MSLFQSVEFYVIIFVVAALVIGIMAMPNGHGPAETSFTEGFLTLAPEGIDPAPHIDIECKGDGTLKITRYGLDLSNSATIALAITRKGFDIAIEERITPHARALLASEHEPADTAVFFIPGLGHERYHIRYNSAPTSTFTALSIHNRPGLTATRPLTAS